MITGNPQAHTILEKYFQAAQSWADGAKFLVLSGPQWVGKTTLVETHIMQLLWLFAAQDYMPLYDLSDVTWKKHTFKVDVAAKEQSVQGGDGKLYRDMGARQVNERLALAPAGDFKIVYLENIERMTTSAANALLKSLEEPLPGRIIIASTTNYKKLLDTIVSRALIVRFEPLSYDNVDQYLQEKHPWVAPSIRWFVAAYALWAPGRWTSLLESGKDLGAMSESFEMSVKFYQQGWSVVSQYQRLQLWNKEFGAISHLLDALIYRVGDDNALPHVIDHLIEWKKLMTTNVSLDTILFWLSIDPHAAKSS